MFKVLTTLLLILLLSNASHGASSSFYPKDHTVIDLSKNIEWLRCSVGQQWNGDTCIGETLLMNHQLIKEAINILGAESIVGHIVKAKSTFLNP